VITLQTITIQDLLIFLHGQDGANLVDIQDEFSGSNNTNLIMAISALVEDGAIEQNGDTYKVPDEQRDMDLDVYLDNIIKLGINPTDALNEPIEETMNEPETHETIMKPAPKKPKAAKATKKKTGSKKVNSKSSPSPEHEKPKATKKKTGSKKVNSKSSPSPEHETTSIPENVEPTTGSTEPIVETPNTSDTPETPKPIVETPNTSDTPETPKVPGKRGRKPMSDEERAAKIAAKDAEKVTKAAARVAAKAKEDEEKVAKLAEEKTNRAVYLAGKEKEKVAKAKAAEEAKAKKRAEKKQNTAAKKAQGSKVRASWNIEEALGAGADVALPKTINGRTSVKVGRDITQGTEVKTCWDCGTLYPKFNGDFRPRFSDYFLEAIADEGERAAKAKAVQPRCVECDRARSRRKTGYGAIRKFVQKFSELTPDEVVMHPDRKNHGYATDGEFSVLLITDEEMDPKLRGDIVSVAFEKDIKLVFSSDNPEITGTTQKVKEMVLRSKSTIEPPPRKPKKEEKPKTPKVKTEKPKKEKKGERATKQEANATGKLVVRDLEAEKKAKEEEEEARVKPSQEALSALVDTIVDASTDQDW
jgi:hypothetical protein